MPEPDRHVPLTLRLVLSFVTAVLIAGTAHVCAWLQYVEAMRSMHLEESCTLWQFTFEMPTVGMEVACALAGAVAFPICFLASYAYRGNRRTLLLVLAAHGVTAFFAILVALVLCYLHLIPLISGH